MKALLISPDTQSTKAIDINGHDDIVKLIGFVTITSDEIGPEGDRLYFDEECFLRGTSGRFQIDAVVPVSATGVIVGSGDGGNTLRDVVSYVDSMLSRINGPPRKLKLPSSLNFYLGSRARRGPFTSSGRNRGVPLVY